MQITNLRRSGEGAMFDVHITPEIALRDWTLKRTGAGLRTFPPKLREGRSSIVLAPHVHEQITQAARAAMEGAVLDRAQ